MPFTNGFGEGLTRGIAAGSEADLDQCPDSAQDGSAIARPLSGSTPPPGVLHRCVHTRFAVVLPRVALIVRAATQAKILDRALATHRPRIHVVELEAAPRATAPPIR